MEELALLHSALTLAFSEEIAPATFAQLPISFRPLLHSLKRLVGLRTPDLAPAAAEQWEVAPATTRFIPPAKYLPGQIERIRRTEFGTLEHVVNSLRGGQDIIQGPTMGYRLKNVDLHDGVLYASRALRHLRKRSTYSPLYPIPTESTSGSLYETWSGNRWFGSWLLEDCLTYPLSARAGRVITTAMPSRGHKREYELALGISARQVSHVHFEELTLFKDDSDNDDRKRRADEFRVRLVGTRQRTMHAGVFLLRRDGGDRRVLTNELSLAEQLAASHGLRVVDPMRSTLEELIEACAGARVVVGVEGSQLVHGIMVMPPDATLLVLQPPERVVSVLKATTDRQGQSFAFVVGEGGSTDFTVSHTEVGKTLDLVDSSSARQCG